MFHVSKRPIKPRQPKSIVCNMIKCFLWKESGCGVYEEAEGGGEEEVKANENVCVCVGVYI